MAYWLFKQEPDAYPFSQLVLDTRTAWTGVTNALAVRHLRSVAVGDQVFYYHTGKERAIVGIMRIAAAATDDADAPGQVFVEVEPVNSLARPVTLAEIKADELFAEWELVRQSRLSVMPVPVSLWKAVLKLSKQK